MLTVVAVAEFAGVVGWRPLANRWASGGLVALSLVVAVGAVRAFPSDRTKTRRVSSETDRWRALSLLPAATLVAYAVQRQLALSRADRVEWFLGGDHVRHLIFVVDERATGSLTYAHAIYPRAWQTLITAVWSTSGARLDTASGLVSLVDIMSTAVWLLFALLVAITGQIGMTLAGRVGLTSSGAGLAGLVAGALAMLPSFLANYQALGFENSVVAAVLLAVVARELLDRPDSYAALIVSGASVALMANVWQLLLPPTVAAFGFCAVALARRVGRRALAWVLVVGVVATSIAAPGMVDAVTGIGIGHATDAGVVAPLPLVLLPMGCIALAIVLGRSLSDVRVLGFGVVAGLPAVTGLGVAAWVGIPATQYYPSKLIWHTALLCLVPIGVLAARGLQALRDRTSLLAVVAKVTGAVALALVVAYAFAAPLAAQLHKWSTVHAGPVLAALTTPGAPTAQVVWLSGGRADSTITRILLDYYRADRTSHRTSQTPLSVHQECQLLTASGAPMVLSDEQPSAVKLRYSCINRVSTIEVRQP